MTPLASASRSAAVAGKWRDHTPCKKKRRFSAATASTRSASSAVAAIDFSTARPASRHASESSTWRALGVAM